MIHGEVVTFLGQLWCDLCTTYIPVYKLSSEVSLMRHGVQLLRLAGREESTMQNAWTAQDGQSQLLRTLARSEGG